MTDSSVMTFPASTSTRNISTARMMAESKRKTADIMSSWDDYIKKDMRSIHCSNPDYRCPIRLDWSCGPAKYIVSTYHYGQI
eukprot:10143587-Ditylum_brightwellii.AAC.1